MPYFNDDREVYKYIGGVFREAGDHPDAGPKLRAAGVTLGLHYTQPESELTIRFSDDYKVIEGPADVEPDVHLYMTADTAHKFWRGEYNLGVGMAKGQVKSKGPVNKILKLVPLTKPLFPIYRQLTAEKETANTPA